MKQTIEWINNLLSNDDMISSKRFVGLITTFALIIYAFIFPSESANNSLLILALGALSISGYEKIFTKNK